MTPLIFQLQTQPNTASLSTPALSHLETLELHLLPANSRVSSHGNNRGLGKKSVHILPPEIASGPRESRGRLEKVAIVHFEEVSELPGEPFAYSASSGLHF